MKKRLLDVFALMRVEIPEVAKKSGVKRNTLNQFKTSRTTSMNCHTLAAIVNAYPQINANYILTGQGKPFIAPDPVPSEPLRVALTDIIERAERALK